MNSTSPHNSFRYQLKSILGCLMCCAVFVSCSSSYSGKADIGNNTVPELGLPYITVTTSSNVTETGQTQALVYISIFENSLIFKNQRDSLVSRISISLDIIRENDNAEISKTYQILLGKDPDTKYYEQNTIYRRFQYDLPPGEYNVKVGITDLHSGKQTTKGNDLYVPDPNARSVSISNVRFYEKPSPEENFLAVNRYNVNTGFDSLKFTFQVTNGKASELLDIESKLIRFEADTKPARSMSERSLRRSSIEYKGLDFTDRNVVQSNARKLEAMGSVTIENSFTDLSKGNYRFEVKVETSSGETFFEVRDFSIKSKNFPSLKSPKELAEPLIYIMRENEYNELLKIGSEDSLKSAIDEYWLSNIKNVPKTRRILQLYYERVEQANIQFSNFKEGWKTDPGMIYILFGPPLYIDSGFGEMTWFYEFDSGNRTPRIFFEDKRYGNTKFPFENFILKRSSDLFNLQYRQIQAWRDGSILYLSQ
ncbi:GWxTD domain-containing protein [Gracilimonas sediminicola]|uniref:GWxTD domain-containing protein n=1 Tax=Gracilimonas sediminicola TaxID=2952158 RepID=A0A9X2L637_9BACT|nr:GWxTD domain-containing protein [Gracilimonas sediminicola]MCP9292248.1 GWxTD domain-containing protein [Gracilimonas sediminicola]